MIDIRKKEKIKACIAIFFIILAILITCIIILKYEVEGESNMPFVLSKITVVSTAEGIQREGTEEKWNLDIFQNNDIYFSIEKNEKNKDEYKIESISIENIQITKLPEVGEIKAFMPNSSEGRLFTNAGDTLITDNKILFKGATKSNNKTLEIGNQGGTVVIRFANTGIGNYISNEDEEIKHDGSLISKLQLEEKQIEFEVTFDLKINLKNKSYMDTISIKLPCDENLIEQGTTNLELTDGFVFKRI